MKRRTTKWRPALWERRYRGVLIWVEEMYAAAPKWEWRDEYSGEGRARTRADAMRAAEKHVRDSEGS